MKDSIIEIIDFLFSYYCKKVHNQIKKKTL